MNIKQKQAMLKELGFYKGNIDGLYGPLTIKAVKGFQKNYGLVIDGLCGPITSKKLNEVYIYNAKNFVREEFKCGCKGRFCNGYPVEMTKDAILTIQQIRNHFGKPLRVTSAIRCKKFNSSLQGSSIFSKHLKGTAIDFRIDGVSKYTVLAYVKTLPQIKYAYTNETNMKNAVHINL
jgi:hypothetical protein